jgi:hypothetical protein
MALHMSVTPGGRIGHTHFNTYGVEPLALHQLFVTGSLGWNYSIDAIAQCLLRAAGDYTPFELDVAVR